MTFRLLAELHEYYIINIFADRVCPAKVSDV